MSVLLDSETIVLEALDFEVSCAKKSAGEHPATALIRCVSCGSTAPICDPHLLALRTTLSSARIVECVKCGLQGRDLDSISEVVPL